MSRFRIYRIEHFDPLIVGKKKRRLAFMTGIGSVLIIIVFQICVQFLNVNYLIILSALPFILALSIYLNSRLKTDLRKIRTIGEIEFTKSCIKKKLGDIYIEYDFHLIRELELRKHIPAISPEDSKSGYFSYILKITFNDSITESLILSDRPVDRKQDISIVETLRTLKKIIRPEITILV
jgi:hypothetical protein